MAASEKKPFAQAALDAVVELPRGFVLATKEADIALSYLSSFAVSLVLSGGNWNRLLITDLQGRSSATIVTAFIPLLVNHVRVALSGA